jgi:four helix bundle protein
VPYRTDLRERTRQFALELLRKHSRIAAAGPPYAHIALHLFQAGSSIGSQLEEGVGASSRRDMAHQHLIALRETREARRWLRLLLESEKFGAELKPLLDESGEFVAMLTESVKTLRADGSDLR